MTPEQLEAMTVNDLKALAYDNLVIIETSQKNLQVISAHITKKSQLIVEAPTE